MQINATVDAYIAGVMDGSVVVGGWIKKAVSGDIPANAANTTGSAATLTTARTINGTSFNGSANITVTAAAGTLTGTALPVTVTTASGLTTVAGGTFGTAAFTASSAYDAAGSATTAQTAATAAFTGDVTKTAGSFATTVTKTNGVAFAPSATTDTTNAANITSGTLTSARLPSNALLDSICFTVDGGGASPSTGSKGFTVVPYACTINAVTLLSDVSGSAVIDIKKAAYSGFPTTTSITASAQPTLSSVQKNQDSTLTGWTKSISAGDVLEFVVNSATTLTRVNLILSVTRT